ncbi:MAG: hypothetical protein QM730_28735 [Anaerolineales bacterium]
MSLLWSRIVDEVQAANKNAGTLTLDSLSPDLKAIFTRKSYAVIPDEFSKHQSLSDIQSWDKLTYSSDLAIANLLGSWNEQNEADGKVIAQLSNKNSKTWFSTIGEILQQPTSPLTLRNGRWRVAQRQALWDTLCNRIFDNNLDEFKNCAIEVLTERNPEFDLPMQDRFAASMYGKTSKHSIELRKGMAETLAILGNRPHSLTNCSLNKAEFIAISSVRKILDDADWVLWGSLNDLLPLLAEAAPNEFLDAVEHALQKSPSPFDQLFPRESAGISGRNYITRLLWALETLAWEDEFLVRTTVILGELTTHDTHETNWANRPSNSLQTIFLPWFPQTKASLDKRKVAIQTLIKEVPDAAWQLLLKLLPNQIQSTSGSHKPIWRDTISDDWGKNIPQKDYWDQILFYADQAVSMASKNIGRLIEITENIDNLPKPSFEKVLDMLHSESNSSKSDVSQSHMIFWKKFNKVYCQT